MATNWGSIFDNWGVKTVTKTDKNKGAYVPNAQQVQAVDAAGIKPATTRPAPGFPVTVLFDPAVASVESSYYHAERTTDPGRTPEPRMGHNIISTWLNEGDTVVIGNVGSQLFAAKTAQAAAASQDTATQEVVKRANPSTILKKAKEAKGKPAKQTVAREDFVRNPFVVAGALQRADGRCEMPACTTPLFRKDDGTPYLEVHHIQPLGEGGDDTLVNAAAVCPRCHREMHFGKDRMLKRSALKTEVAKKPV